MWQVMQLPTEPPGCDFERAPRWHEGKNILDNSIQLLYSGLGNCLALAVLILIVWLSIWIIVLNARSNEFLAPEYGVAEFSVQRLMRAIRIVNVSSYDYREVTIGDLLYFLRGNGTAINCFVNSSERWHDHSTYLCGLGRCSEVLLAIKYVKGIVFKEQVPYIVASIAGSEP